MCSVHNDTMISFLNYIMSLECSQAKNFRLIMEGTCPELVDLNPTIYQPLSCRSIFSKALPSRKLNISMYLYHCPSDADCRSRSLFFEWKGNSQDLNSGKYHLLWLSHKFPIQQKVCCNHAKINNRFKFWTGH